MKETNGFTLVEILVALLITALILGGISSTLHAVVSAEEAVDTAIKGDRLARLLLNRMDREIVSVVRKNSFAALVAPGSSPQAEIILWTNTYGSPRRVEYTWKGKRFFRIEEDPVIEHPPREVPIVGVEELQMDFFDGETWLSSWTKPEVPLGVRIVLIIEGKKYGSIIDL